MAELEILQSVPSWLIEGDDSAAHAESHRALIESLVAPLEVRLEATTRFRKLTPTEKRKARKSISTYLLQCESHEASKHYSQHRPMTHLGDAPGQAWDADCSGYATGALYWADKWLPFPIEDPNGLGYSGWGYTGTLLSHNISHIVPLNHTFFVGDMGLYGPASRTRHVVICRKGGNLSTSIWSSFGSERGPNPVRLNYRSDVLCVVRPRSLL